MPITSSTPAVPQPLHLLFRTAEKFCFSWPVHTVPAGDRADSAQER